MDFNRAAVGCVVRKEGIFEKRQDGGLSSMYNGTLFNLYISIVDFCVKLQCYFEICYDILNLCKGHADMSV